MLWIYNIHFNVGARPFQYRYIMTTFITKVMFLFSISSHYSYHASKNGHGIQRLKSESMDKQRHELSTSAIMRLCDYCLPQYPLCSITVLVCWSTFHNMDYWLNSWLISKSNYLAPLTLSQTCRAEAVSDHKNIVKLDSQCHMQCWRNNFKYG